MHMLSDCQEHMRPCIQVMYFALGPNYAQLHVRVELVTYYSDSTVYNENSLWDPNSHLLVSRLPVDPCFDIWSKRDWLRVLSKLSARKCSTLESLKSWRKYFIHALKTRYQFLLKSMTKRRVNLEPRTILSTTTPNFLTLPMSSLR